MQEKKNIKPLPFPVYAATLSGLTLIGLADAIYLMLSHYWVYTDIGYQSFCALSKAVNCDTVSQSDYSIFMGVPVAFWGLIGYVGFGLLLLQAFRKDAGRQRIWGLLIIAAAIFSAVSFVLGYISGRYIHSYCLMCIVSFAVNFILLFFSWLTRRRFDHSSLLKALSLDMAYLASKCRAIALWFIPYIIMIITIVMFFPPYWTFEMPVLSAAVHQGITDDGHPWIGAEDPELIIEEFSDYMCFQCKKTHYLLRRLVDLHPDRIRLVHHHFPMDHTINPLVTEPYHVGSAKLALFAIYATSINRFWEMNDLLFKIARGRSNITIAEMATLHGYDANKMAADSYTPKMVEQLWNDIRTGIRLGITATPGFVVDGKVYIGEIPAEVLKPIIE